MARRTKSAGAKGEHREPLLSAVRTADAGKPAARIAPVQIAIKDFFDDEPEEAILSLEPALVLGQESLEIIEQRLIEDGALRMSRTINSCHSRSFSSRKQM